MINITSMKIAKQIQQKRKEMKKTLLDLAKMLDLPRETLRAYESGRVERFDFCTVKKIFEGIGIASDALEDIINDPIKKFSEFYKENKIIDAQNEEIEDINQKIIDFKKNFPLHEIKNMMIEDYVVGAGSKSSICYELEYGKYAFTGPSIKGGSTHKFGLFYSKSKNSYQYKKNIIEEEKVDYVWREFREQLYNYLVELKDFTNFIDIDNKYTYLRGMSLFLNKLAFLYFPEKFTAIGKRNSLITLLKHFNFDYDEKHPSEQLSHILNDNMRQVLPELNNEDPTLIGRTLWNYYELLSERVDAEVTDMLEKSEINNYQTNTYTKNEFMKEVFMSDDVYDDIINVLQRKKNIILQGVPGVGKTFRAKKLFQSMLGYREETNIETVQFHQSYSYEDFIEGFRPNKDGQFELVKGLFYDFVIRAREEYEKASYKEDARKFCIIIDEINRGNLSKIFGELMLLIESNKRDKKWEIKLCYSDEKFYLPDNLYIIGTMNTADRSLTTIDYALRRRFAFFTLEPAFDNDEFKEYLKNNESIPEYFVEEICDDFKKLNNYIISNLGENFVIGHSYFVETLDADDLTSSYEYIIKYEITPLLEEYYFDDKEKIEEALLIIRN